jgi:hypothetical protein
MPIETQGEPEGGRDTVHAALAARSHRAPLSAPGGVLQTCVPLPLYVLSPTEAGYDDPLPAARHVGWQYPVVGGEAPALAFLQNVKDGGVTFGGVSYGALPARLLDAAMLADDSLKGRSGRFEPRLLEIPGLRMNALWLREVDGGADFFVSLEEGHRSDPPPLQLLRDIKPRIEAARAELRTRASAAAAVKKAKRNKAERKKRKTAVGAAIVSLVILSALVPFAPLEFAWLGSSALGVWLIDLFLVAALVAVLGVGFKQSIFGILIDGRNKFSLSRLQIVLWTILFVATFFVAYVWNIGHTADLSKALALVVPSTVWLLMGMSGVSAAGSPAILSAKPDTGPAAPPPALKDDAKFVDGVVVKRKAGEAAQWSDMILGDEVGNTDAIDVGKVQLLLLTLVAIVAYGFAIAQTLVAANGGVIAKLPDMDNGFLTLIGASHLTYLGYKGVSHSN